jgi:hypothetical protein
MADDDDFDRPVTRRARSPSKIILSVPFGDLSLTGLSLPDNLTHAQWVDVGHTLASSNSVLQLAIGDWWVFGSHKYGDRRTVVEVEDWTGPSFEICRNCADVSLALETSRRSKISFSHHREVAALPLDEADALLAQPKEKG